MSDNKPFCMMMMMMMMMMRCSCSLYVQTIPASTSMLVKALHSFSFVKTLSAELSQMQSLSFAQIYFHAD